MPALTVKTDALPQSSNRSTSPVRPPISPITPPLAATKLPGDAPSASTLPPRQGFTHTTHPAQASSILPPAPEPIDFSANPDAIALKSAISVLQVQRQRATADIQALSRAKDDAVRDPEAFVSDLVAGKVNAPQSQLSLNLDDDDADPSQAAQRSWASLPKPQDIVRCPPINWSQYAVVGESLDRLHAEQIDRPLQGSPAVTGPGGVFEFRGEADGVSNQSRAERYIGVAAPYAPGRDKIDGKSKGKK